MTLQEELTLVNEAKSNVQAFNRLYEYYFDKIYRYCLNRLGDRESSEDITSQVFLLAVEHIGKFDSSKEVRFGSWLYKVAQNKIIDYYRKNKKQVLINFEEHEVVDEENVLEKALHLDSLQKNIRYILFQLKPSYQEVISLRFYSELSIGEIAEVLNLKPKQVSVILHRALKDFRKKYLKNYPGSEIFESF
jgi:RNA polymerase sigma-70 factor (ECF subfamily)